MDSKRKENPSRQEDPSRKRNKNNDGKEEDLDPNSTKDVTLSKSTPLFFSSKVDQEEQLTRVAINIMRLFDIKIKLSEYVFTINNLANALEMRGVNDIAINDEGYEEYQLFNDLDDYSFYYRLIGNRVGNLSPIAIVNKIIELLNQPIKGSSKLDPEIYTTWINKTVNKLNATLLHLFAALHHRDDGAAVKKLLLNRVDPEIEDYSEETFIFILFKTKQPPSIELLKSLVDKKINFVKKNKYGENFIQESFWRLSSKLDEDADEEKVFNYLVGLIFLYVKEAIPLKMIEKNILLNNADNIFKIFEDMFSAFFVILRAIAGEKLKSPYFFIVEDQEVGEKYKNDPKNEISATIDEVYRFADALAEKEKKELMTINIEACEAYLKRFQETLEKHGIKISIPLKENSSEVSEENSLDILDTSLYQDTRFSLHK